jgi:hypothetical protein
MGESPHVCRFGAYKLDMRTGELRKNGVRLRETVTRDQIQKRLWPDGTFVDFENVINSAARKLREVLE